VVLMQSGMVASQCARRIVVSTDDEPSGAAVNEPPSRSAFRPPIPSPPIRETRIRGRLQSCRSPGNPAASAAEVKFCWKNGELPQLMH